MPNSGQELGPVVIGPREIYDAVIRLQGAVERLADQNVVLTSDFKDHEARIRSLEKSRWPLPSLSILVALVSIGIAVVNFIR